MRGPNHSGGAIGKAQGWPSLGLAGILALAVLLAGCGEELDTRYGEMSGDGAASVNGTSVLADLFKQAGHKVSPAYALTPKLREKAEVIVWFPDDFEPPKNAIRGWFESWLHGGRDRVLIYVGRDYDAVVTYWDTLLPTLAADSPEAREMKLELNKYRGAMTSRRQDASRVWSGRTVSDDDFDDWFEPDYERKQVKVRKLQGARRWTSQVDAAKSEIELTTLVEPIEDADTLLETADGESLVSAVDWLPGRIILVANGSFLLNLPLVNHEHRKLAGRLIDEIGRKPREVVFLESDRFGPRIADDDETARSGLEILTIPPFDLILLHLSIAGVIFAFASWPIFGIARPWVVERVGDFGQHIGALGRLMQATRNRAYAEERLRQYEQTGKGERERGRQRDGGTKRWRDREKESARD